MRSGASGICGERQRSHPKFLQRGIPFVVVTGVKDQIRIGIANQPRVLRNLTFQLPRAPARIAKRDDRMFRPSPIGQIFENVLRRRHREIIIHVQR